MLQHNKNISVIQPSSRAAANRSSFTGISQPAVVQKTAVIQRQALTKIVGEWNTDNYDIYDVIIGGRTLSPFSNTMGAHSTAWVAHIDAIRRHLVGTTMSVGIDWFLGTINEDLDSPLRKLDGYIGKEQWAKLDFATYQLKVSRDNLVSVSAKITAQNYHNVLQVLRIAINAYLTYINLLPTSTVAGGDPSGHGEGVARGEINYFEFAASQKFQKEEGTPSNTGLLETYTPLDEKDLNTTDFTGMDTELRKLLKGDLKEGELALYKKHIRATLWTMFAEETPEVFAQGHENTQRKEVKEEIWALTLQNFLRTIRVAYPFAYDFCKMNDMALLTNDVTLKIPTLNVAHIVKLVNGEETFINIAGSYNFKDEDDRDKVKSKLSGSHQLNESEVRGSAYGDSDIAGGGSGFQVTVLLNDLDNIGDIITTGRTKSPFSGTMGAHTTAWAVHQDAVINTLTGLPLSSAILQLSLMTQEAMKSPQLEFAGVIDEKHQIFLVAAFNEARKFVGKVGENFKQNVGVKTAFLENFIATYLNLLNVTPLATIAKGGVPGGRREGQHRQFLKRYETDGDAVFSTDELGNKTKIITDHLLGMFDTSGLNYFPPSLVRREATNISEYVTDGFDNTHALWDFVQDKGTEKANQKKKKYALDQFLHTVAEAYPRSLRNSNLVATLTEKHSIDLAPPKSPSNVMGHNVVVVGNKQDPNAQLNKGYIGEIRGISPYGITVLIHATFKTVVLQPGSIKFI
ncbi:hypothetical protein [[Flexibacter] sp. ATCC 35208]|uniref:hypothetical protein n=1 Tax=[Flexibacter] sp. ATCC 35208 TaxID=1936242 RepID=UPI0009D4FC01|nr:hypothetical protein [[Flexibacter] sp. ATCC 35208]OMP78054.1 hypothetical protein BW716_16625 [[Flexibacter] sp. ATCC 35208]